jgi:GTP-binding protein Era
LIFGLNKADQRPGETGDAAERAAEYLDLVPWLKPVENSLAVTWVTLSGLTGEGEDALMSLLRTRLPFGPRYYPEDQVTDLQVRFIAAELVREQALRLLQQEVPHSIAVEVDEFSERDDDLTYISAVIYVERESQKGIVLGQRGSMIKKIGQAARPEIEELVGARVYLELWVKVWEKWRTREGMLRRLGYAISQQ